MVQRFDEIKLRGSFISEELDRLRLELKGAEAIVEQMAVDLRNKNDRRIQKSLELETIHEEIPAN